ncbi:MAG: hypothetical protein ACRCWG_13535 [Sarcina sp.]
MTNIKEELNQINTAIYGSEVRGALYTGLNSINNEVETLSNNQQEFEGNISNQLKISNNDIVAMKEVVEKSKDIIDNAGNLAEKVNVLGNAIINTTTESIKKFDEINDNAYRANLLVDSNFTGDYSTGGLQSSSSPFATRITAYEVEKGKVYTLSAKGYINQSIVDKNGGMKVAIYDNKWGTNSYSFNINSVNPIINSITFTASEDTTLQVSSYIVVNNNNPSKDKATICWYSLTEGDVQAKNYTSCILGLEGGLNLFPKSNFGEYGANTIENGDFWQESEIVLKANQIYTFTAKASSEKNTSNSGALALLYNPNWEQTISLFFTPQNGSNILSATFIPSTDGIFKFGFYSRSFDGLGHDVNCTLYWYTVVEGAKRKAWIPSLGEIKGNTNSQLMSLGHMTTQMMLTQTNTQKETKNIGQNISQLMLENSQLKDQVKLLGKIIIEMQLNK